LVTPEVNWIWVMRVGKPALALIWMNGLPAPLETIGDSSRITVLPAPAPCRVTPLRISLWAQPLVPGGQDDDVTSGSATNGIGDIRVVQGGHKVGRCVSRAGTEEQQTDGT